MTPTQAQTAPLEYMTLDELRWAYAHCDAEIRKCVQWGERMEALDTRRAKIEAMILTWKPAPPRQHGGVA